MRLYSSRFIVCHARASMKQNTGFQFQDTSKMKIAKHIDIWIMFSDHQLIRSNVTISWSISLPFAKVLMKYNMFLLVPLKGLNRVTFTIWISPYKWGDNGYCNMLLNFPKRQLKIYYEIPFNQFPFSSNSRKLILSIKSPSIKN